MKIQGRKSQSVGAVGPIGFPAAAPAQPTQETSGPEGADQVSVGSATEVRRLQKAIEMMPTVRAEKVEGLRGAIEDGSYYVESDKLARKVVDDMLSDALLSNTQGRSHG